MNKPPPPVIDSTLLLEFAFNDKSISFTDRIALYVGSKSGMKRLGEVPNMAICLSFADEDEYLLFFCNSNWESAGVIPFNSLEEAKIKAERGYEGISRNWQISPYSENEVKDFIRDEYNADPNSEWWTMRCSFCGKDDSETTGMLQRVKATICRECVESFYNHFQSNDDA